MGQLASNTAYINNIFGAQNVGMMMVMLGVQYNGSYGAICFVTISARAMPVDDDTAFVFSVAHTALCC